MKTASTHATGLVLAVPTTGEKTTNTIGVYNVLQINSTQKQSAVLIDEPNHLRRYGPSLDAKTDAAFNNSLVFRSC